MALFTIVLEFGGGTYVGQINGKTAQEALVKWATGLDSTAVDGLNTKDKDALMDELKADVNVGMSMAEVEGAKNVWCTTALVRGKFALFNVVKTAA